MAEGLAAREIDGGMELALAESADLAVARGAAHMRLLGAGIEIVAASAPQQPIIRLPAGDLADKLPTTACWEYWFEVG